MVRTVGLEEGGRGGDEMVGRALMRVFLHFISCLVFHPGVCTE